MPPATQTPAKTRSLRRRSSSSDQPRTSPARWPRSALPTAFVLLFGLAGCASSDRAGLALARREQEMLRTIEMAIQEESAGRVASLEHTLSRVDARLRLDQRRTAELSGEIDAALRDEFDRPRRIAPRLEHELRDKLRGHPETIPYTAIRMFL